MAFAIAFYTVTRQRPTRLLLLATGCSALVVALALIWRTDVSTAISGLLIIAVAAAAADSSSSRASYIRTIQERAKRAEQSRDAEARGLVVEERLRIARDLHDTLAHQIAVINLHSGAASRAMHGRPEDAERSLATIRSAAKTVLSEMSEILSVLRGPEDGAERRPVGTLDELDRLIDEFARTGLTVHLRRSGIPRPLPEATTIAAYRVVQEGLTNAHKHGALHTADLHIAFLTVGLDITVVNRTPSPVRSGGSGVDRSPNLDAGFGAGRGATPAFGSGHGLVGLQERVGSAGGHMATATTTGADGPCFELAVRLPYGDGTREP